jgi:hypothetical protein
MIFHLRSEYCSHQLQCLAIDSGVKGKGMMGIQFTQLAEKSTQVKSKKVRSMTVGVNPCIPTWLIAGLIEQPVPHVGGWMASLAMLDIESLG